MSNRGIDRKVIDYRCQILSVLVYQISHALSDLFYLQQLCSKSFVSSPNNECILVRGWLFSSTFTVNKCNFIMDRKKPQIILVTCWATMDITVHQILFLVAQELNIWQCVFNLGNVCPSGAKFLCLFFIMQLMKVILQNLAQKRRHTYFPYGPLAKLGDVGN